MPSKSTKKGDRKSAKRGEERAKKAAVDDIPAIIVELPDEAMQQAALALAACGYRRGSNRRNGAVNYAARQANVSRETIYNWLEKYPEFETAIHEVNSIFVAECIAGLRLCVMRGDAKGITEFLSRLDPEMDPAWLRERERREHEKEMLRLRFELEAKAKLGAGDGEVKPEPDFTFRETAPGERLVDDDDDPDDDE
ncbi:hypothetical protein EP7_004309 [Isosphaeraceae bacterium EP7]